MLAIGIVYLFSMPLSIRSYRRLERAANDLRAARLAPEAPLLRAIEGRDPNQETSRAGRLL
jgi:hypothetical protein